MSEPLPDPLQACRQWVEDEVIGHTLCPFARAVVRKGQLRWVLATPTDDWALVEQVEQECRLLLETDPAKIDTTLIVVDAPWAADFAVFNDSLGMLDRQLQMLRLDGVLQIASFHPQYCFDDLSPQDAANRTNRSPWPMVHLLREDSVARAVAAYPEAETIYERNMALMRARFGAGE